jgi:hypothetical protein
MAAGTPPIVTDDTSAAVIESGTVLAVWMELARLVPNSVINDPGATGVDIGFTTGCPNANPPAKAKTSKKTQTRIVFRSQFHDRLARSSVTTVNL